DSAHAPKDSAPPRASAAPREIRGFAADSAHAPKGFRVLRGHPRLRVRSEVLQKTQLTPQKAPRPPRASAPPREIRGFAEDSAQPPKAPRLRGHPRLRVKSGVLQ